MTGSGGGGEERRSAAEQRTRRRDGMAFVLGARGEARGRGRVYDGMGLEEGGRGRAGGGRSNCSLWGLASVRVSLLLGPRAPRPGPACQCLRRAPPLPRPCLRGLTSRAVVVPCVVGSGQARWGLEESPPPGRSTTRRVKGPTGQRLASPLFVSFRPKCFWERCPRRAGAGAGAAAAARCLFSLAHTHRVPAAAGVMCDSDRRT